MPRKKKVEEPVVNEVPKRKPGRPKKSDAAVAAEIEVKKTVRAAGRKVKETAAEAAAAVREAAEEQAVASEIEVKKTVRKAGRKARKILQRRSKKPSKRRPSTSSSRARWAVPFPRMRLPGDFQKGRPQSMYA